MGRRTVLAAVCAASCAFYLGVSLVQNGNLSFPLDDAWIHLTFARNLALRSEFAFMPGQLSAGSTSPLWTIILVPGFWWPFGPQTWAYVLGVALLFCVGLLGWRVTLLLFPELRERAFLTSLVVVLEWHLNWAAYSGMETLLVIGLCLFVVERHLSRSPAWLVGLIGGLAMVTRPESVILVGLVEMDALRRSIPSTSLRSIMMSILLFTAGVVVPLVPYGVFNFIAGGSLVPNTFFAKQAEYAELVAQTPFFARLGSLIVVTWVGAHVLLLPGFLYAAWLIWKQRRLDAGILLAWCVLLLIVYALRLPVTYQHGRYAMPVIPALLILGMWGSAQLLSVIPAGALQRVVTRTGSMAFAVLLLFFWLRGATALATDSAIIDCIDVQSAKWLAANSRSNEVIALHDVGAAGYYLNDRPLLDLAGLITPDVIPFIRDEPRLMQYMLTHNAQYLVTSEVWHPLLIANSRVSLLHESTCPLVAQEGGYSIGIYRVAPP